MHNAVGSDPRLLLRGLGGGWALQRQRIDTGCLVEDMAEDMGILEMGVHVQAALLVRSKTAEQCMRGEDISRDSLVKNEIDESGNSAAGRSHVQTRHS